MFGGESWQKSGFSRQTYGLEHLLNCMGIILKVNSGSYIFCAAICRSFSDQNNFLMLPAGVSTAQGVAIPEGRRGCSAAEAAAGGGET